MDWLVAFLDKTPAELNLGEALILLAFLCLVGIVICLIFLKALQPSTKSMRFPKPSPDAVNPFREVLKKRQARIKRKES